MPAIATSRPTRAAPPPQQGLPADAMVFGAPIELKANDDGGLPARFSGTAYSGGLVPDYGVVIDMASTTYNAKLPLLDSHARWDIVGVIEQAATRDFQMQVSGNLFSDMPGSSAERIAQLAQRGVPFEMSVGLYAFRREFVPAGETVKVNGQTFNGPVNVLRNGQVREVSIVTLGADPRTTSKFFDLVDGDPSMKTIEQLTAEVAELTAKTAGHAAALDAARAEGAVAERDRIKAVQAQALAGHEQLIGELMFDGKTSGAEAAVAVLSAERKLRGQAAIDLAADAPAPLKPAATPVVDAAAAAATAAAAAQAALPLEERCKAQWAADPALRAEFESLTTYTAFERAQAAGKVRVLNTRSAA